MTEIPEFLKHLPIHRGYPVPYFVPKDNEGVYQLKYASQEKMESCIKYHKCCICFRPLVVGNYFFISGPRGFETKTDSHPPMHRSCAEYSLKVCPHLYFEKTHRTTDEDNGASWQIREKPKEFFLVHASHFKDKYPDGKTLIVIYSGVKSFSRFIYQNGKLINEGTVESEQIKG